MSSSVSSRHSDVVSMLIVGASKSARATIAPHLGAYPTTLLEQLVEHRCSVRPLRARDGYRDASTALRRLGIDVDAWPVPPAGLFGDVLRGLHDKHVSDNTATFVVPFLSYMYRCIKIAISVLDNRFQILAMRPQ